jgi:hypothetical protein
LWTVHIGKVHLAANILFNCFVPSKFKSIVAGEGEVVALDDSVLAMVTKASELELAGTEKSISMGAPAKRRRPRQKRE